MISARGFRGMSVSVLVAGMWVAAAQGQFYGGPGAGWYGPAGMPYGYPYSLPGFSFDEYGNAYLTPAPYLAPPPLRSLMPSRSYTPNPYAAFPNTFSYEPVPNLYAPNSFTYDLRAYGYGYPPPAYTYPAYPTAPYGYTAPSYYTGRRPRNWRGPYHAMTLGQYIEKGLQGPTRVRDIVPGIPGLGG